MVLPTLTWISSWYAGSYVEGGINPIGWGNAHERYHLCLFWAIQSITSIGYGNIAPVTTVEVIPCSFMHGSPTFFDLISYVSFFFLP